VKFLTTALLGVAFWASQAQATEPTSTPQQGYNNATLNSEYTTLARNNNQQRYKRRVHGFPRKQQATGNRVFIFDPQKLLWAAYDPNGRLISTGRASGGKNYCPDVGKRCLTPRGTFKVYRKGSAKCVSSKFPLGKGGAPMPYCMFFHGGYAIHGSPHLPDYNASHGCIRVHPEAAQWLHQNFMQTGTTVIVTAY